MNVTDFRRSSAVTILGTATNASAVGGVTISSNAVATAGWVLVATGSNSAIWRDAISFGSNTNDVSSVGTMGSSASNSRADHVHRGVRSISHTSNTFFGDVTLTASGNLGITSPASGTYNLSVPGGLGTTISHASNTFSPTLILTTPRDGIALVSPSAGTLEIIKDWHSGSGITGTHWIQEATSPETFGRAAIWQTSGQLLIRPNGAGGSEPLVNLYASIHATPEHRGKIGLTPVANVVAITGGLALEADVTSTVTGTQNNLALALGVVVLRWNGASEATLTGITNGVDGRLIAIANVTTGQMVTLAHDTTSTAANRFYCPGGINVTLAPNSGVVAIYDSTSSRWRVLTAAPVVGQGTAFPTSPVTNQQFFRTDIDGGTLCVYDGTRWLGPPQEVTISVQNALFPTSASFSLYAAMPRNPQGNGWYWIDAKYWFYVTVSAHDGSNKFVCQTYSADAGVDTARGTSVDTNGKGTGTDTSDEKTIGVALASTVDRIWMGATATGTPGEMYCSVTARLRPIYT